LSRCPAPRPEPCFRGTARGLAEMSVRVGHKPSSVPMPSASVMIIPLGRELPHVSSDLPGSFGRATLRRSPIGSCSGWGLPSQPGCPNCWWSLTPPFHPCLCRDAAGLAGARPASGHRRSALCGTLRRVTPPGCYPATRSMELGLSSGPSGWTRDHLASSDAPDSDGLEGVSPLQYRMRWQWEQLRTRSFRRTS
jgi:hypothetical protein